MEEVGSPAGVLVALAVGVVAEGAMEVMVVLVPAVAGQVVQEVAS